MKQNQEVLSIVWSIEEVSEETRMWIYLGTSKIKGSETEGATPLGKKDESKC